MNTYTQIASHSRKHVHHARLSFFVCRFRFLQRHHICMCVCIFIFIYIYTYILCVYEYVYVHIISFMKTRRFLILRVSFSPAASAPLTRCFLPSIPSSTVHIYIISCTQTRPSQTLRSSCFSSGIGLNDKMVSAFYPELYIWNTDGTNRATIPVPKSAYEDFGEIHGLGNVCDIDLDVFILICIYKSVSKCICLYI